MMKVRLGSLRRFLWESLSQTDARMVGDGEGNGEIDPDVNAAEDIADHLRGDEEKRSLGSAPDETMRESSLEHELRLYFLQEDQGDPGGGGSNSSADAPTNTGFYTPFDMDRDHSATWYRSPGRPSGGDGDPFRSADPYAQLGFHPPEGAGGDSGRLAPPIWQLSAGSDTSKVLGANAKPGAGGVDSSGESEEGQEGEDGADGEDGDEVPGQEPDRNRPDYRRD